MTFYTMSAIRSTTMRKLLLVLLAGAVSALLGVAALLLLRIWRLPMAIFIAPWRVVRATGGEPGLVAAAMTLVPDRPLATFLLVTCVSWLVWSVAIGFLLMAVRRRAT